MKVMHWCWYLSGHWTPWKSSTDAETRMAVVPRGSHVLLLKPVCLFFPVKVIFFMLKFEWLFPLLSCTVTATWVAVVPIIIMHLTETWVAVVPCESNVLYAELCVAIVSCESHVLHDETCVALVACESLVVILKPVWQLLSVKVTYRCWNLCGCCSLWKSYTDYEICVAVVPVIVMHWLLNLWSCCSLWKSCTYAETWVAIVPCESNALIMKPEWLLFPQKVIHWCWNLSLLFPVKVCRDSETCVAVLPCESCSLTFQHQSQ